MLRNKKFPVKHQKQLSQDSYNTIFNKHDSSELNVLDWAVSSSVDEALIIWEQS